MIPRGLWSREVLGARTKRPGYRVGQLPYRPALPGRRPRERQAAVKTGVLVLPPFPPSREPTRACDSGAGAVPAGGCRRGRRDIFDVRNRAVDWLLAAQYQVAEWPEALRAAQSYTEARESCINIQRQLDVLKLQGGLPVGSRCKHCPTETTTR